MTGRHKVGTSSISGHTKGVQHINAGSRIKFIDTPGLILFGGNDEHIQGLLAVKDAPHLQDPIGVDMTIITKICAEKNSLIHCEYVIYYLFPSNPFPF